MRRLRAFGESAGVQIWLQLSGPDSCRRLHPADAPGLAYTLPEFGVSMAFRPTDFTQVNMGINRLLMRRSMQLLDPQPGERIADLFCGLGNFSLPIAKLGAHVVGVEGAMRWCGGRPKTPQPTGSPVTASSMRPTSSRRRKTASPPSAARQDADRSAPGGRIAVVKALGPTAPRRIVYVSCNPATLARDTAVLFHEKGYGSRARGLPTCSRRPPVESIALFERD
jgi:23S rRNA (uracil1939-C5)-methyltransferase